VSPLSLVSPVSPVSRSLPSLLLLLTISAVSVEVQAAPPSSAHHDSAATQGRALSFDEAVGAAVTAPGVRGLEAAAEAKRSADGELPTLTEGLQVQVMPGARLPPAGEAGFELQATVTQGWRTGGYGHKRRTAAIAETEALAAEARALALEQELGAARAWILLHEAEARLELARTESSMALELVAVLEVGREAGVVTRVEVAEARARAAGAQAVLTEVAGDVHDLGLALARETGTKATAPLRTRGAYPTPELPGEGVLRERFAALDQLPAVVLRRLESRAAAARAEAAKAAGSTKMSAGISGQLESSGELVLFGVLNATIPVRDHNQRLEASHRAQASRAEAEAVQIEIELSASLAVAVHDLHHTRERLEILRDQILPALDELVAARETALAEGEGTRPELLRAQGRRSAAARESASAEALWVWSRVEVWLYLQAIDSAVGSAVVGEDKQ